MSRKWTPDEDAALTWYNVVLPGRSQSAIRRQQALGVKSTRNRPWSREELEMAANGIQPPGRTRNQYHQIRKQRYMTDPDKAPKEYTEKELAFIRRELGARPLPEIARILRRTHSGLKQKIGKMGLSGRLKPDRKI